MQIKLNNVRLSYPKLFVPEAFKGGGVIENSTKRYDATFLIQKLSEQDTLIRNAINAAAELSYGKKADAFLKSFEGNSNKHCYADGDTMVKDLNGYAGHMALSSHRKEEDGPPKVIDRVRRDIRQEDGVIYGGCYVNAIVDIFAQKGTYPGIRCGLLGVQFFADGESFGGAGKVNADAFDYLGDTGQDSAEDFSNLL